MKNVYSIKMLYFSAGKNLLSDNYQFYKGLVSGVRTNLVCEKIMQIEKTDFSFVLQDRTGAAAARILGKVAEEYSKEETVFLYEDDEISCVPAAIFIPFKNLFVYNDKWNLFKSMFRLNLSGCYSRSDTRKYSSQQYLEIANTYFEKSECIDNINSL